MSDNTGGSAFPRTKYLADDHPIGFEKGMTLRDYFAAKAMQSFIANLEEGRESQAAFIPAVSYAMADAMLRAREQ